MSIQDFTERIMAPMTSKKFFDFCSISPEVFNNKVVLNVGSGGVDLERELKRHNVQTSQVYNIDLGYDPSRKSILWKLLFKLPLSHFPPNATRADWDYIPMASESVDISVMSFSGAFWTEEHDFDQVVSEVMRVTKECVYMTGVLVENMQRLKLITEQRNVGFSFYELVSGYELRRIN